MYRLLSRALACGAFAASLALGFTVPASAAPPGQVQSNQNLWHVRQRLERDIDRLQHDARDYGGHRVSALNDLQAARNEILAGEQYEHDKMITPGTGPGAGGPQTTTQGQSNASIWRVRRNVENLISQLQGDAQDYGGHRVNAINDMQNARTELLAAEQYAKAHGY